MKKLLLILFLSLGFTAASYAESVYVEHQGSVSLDGFYCEKTRSSFVDRICYQEQNNYVLVLLSDNYYQYCRVPYSIVNRWFNATSKGRFYNSNIKGRFDCRSADLEPGRGAVKLSAQGAERMLQGMKQMLGIEYQSEKTGENDACKNGSGALWEIICKD